MTNCEGDLTGGKRFDDQQMEMIMGRLLQIGVLVASFDVLVGGTLYVRRYHGTMSDYRVFFKRTREPATAARGGFRHRYKRSSGYD